MDGLYPLFLDIGGSPFDFWEYTPLEILDLIESFNRVYIQKKKEKIIESYRLSQMIANHVSLLISNEAKVLDVWEYAPELFNEEKAQVEEQRRQQQVLQHKEQMRAFAERFNRMRKEENYEHDS